MYMFTLQVYMIPANQSFYQISTPVDNKKRRLSESAVSRLSIIPSLMEKSFLTEDLPDFEVNEDCQLKINFCLKQWLASLIRMLQVLASLCVVVLRYNVEMLDTCIEYM